MENKTKKLEYQNLIDIIKEKSLDVSYSREKLNFDYNRPRTRIFGNYTRLPFEGQVTSELGNLEKQLESLKNRKSIISLDVGCCDSGTRNFYPVLDRVLEYLESNNIFGNTYLFCDPECSTSVNQLIKRKWIKKKTMPQIKNNQNNIIFGTYLSNKSGWDCGDARDIYEAISRLLFNKNGKLVNDYKFKIINKVDKKQTDYEIFQDLLK